MAVGTGRPHAGAVLVVAGGDAVYQTQGAYESGKGYAYAGGNLTLTTPLVTGAAGSAVASSVVQSSQMAPPTPA